VPAASRHGEDLYLALYRTPAVLVWNKEALAAEEAPADWDDLLAPRFRDRVIIRDPLASGTMRTIFGMILSRSVAETGTPERGFEWLRALDRQTKEYVHSPALMHEKIIRQEGLVTMWDLTDILFQIDRGAPLAYHFPRSGTAVIDDSVGLVHNAPHPEEAARFIDWVGSREAVLLAAERAYRLPARVDLQPAELPAWARAVLSELVAADLDWELIESQGADWMVTWDQGVRGRGR
jgi:iron(III) transport system substrate-binding protein